MSPQAAQPVAMESMTEEEVEMYKGAFRPFDKDGTGATHADGEPKPLQATREVEVAPQNPSWPEGSMFFPPSCPRTLPAVRRL